MKGRLVAFALVVLSLMAVVAPHPSLRAVVERPARSAAPPASSRDGVLARQAIAALPPKPGAVRGVVMDWNLGGGVATLVAIDDGTVNLFMGDEGRVIGAGGKVAVAHAARRFLAEADRVRTGFATTTSAAVPGRDSVTFYVLTDTATLVAPSIDAGTNGGSAALGPLNEAAQRLIAEIRKAS